MTKMLRFDAEAARKTEAAYTTPELVAQRREVLRLLALQPGESVLDIGAGPGFLAAEMAAAIEPGGRVFAVDPSESMRELARSRGAALEIRSGSAEALPLPDDSVDVMHARWAYFFGPGCEPGLAELDRVMRPGSRAFVIDNDPTRSTFGGWFRRGYPDIDPTAVERFWSTQGWTRTPVDMGWRFSTRADLESVVRIEFDEATAEAVLAEHEGVEVDYAVNLWSRGF